MPPPCCIPSSTALRSIQRASQSTRQTGRSLVGSVKEGTIYKGHVGDPRLQGFSPGGADGRTIATGMSYSKGRLVIAGRQTGLIFVYDVKDARLISKLDNGLAGKTFLNDTTFAADGSAYVTDSVNPVLYRVAPVASGGYELQEFLKNTMRNPGEMGDSTRARRNQRQRHSGDAGRENAYHLQAERECSFPRRSKVERDRAHQYTGWDA